jgi:hypothetical protein
LRSQQLINSPDFSACVWAAAMKETPELIQSMLDALYEG